MLHTLVQSINETKQVSFIYNDVRRTAAVHILGFNKDGRAAIRAYQFFSPNTDLNEGFKLFMLSEITGLILLPDKTFTRRPGFRKSDSYFKAVVATL